jgi:hypothetical protein
MDGFLQREAAFNQKLRKGFDYPLTFFYGLFEQEQHH